MCAHVCVCVLERVCITVEPHTGLPCYRIWLLAYYLAVVHSVTVYNRFSGASGSLHTAYSGDTCNDDRNGCFSGGGCYMGVLCADVAAPGSGATCAACPSGLTGDGRVCSGKAISPLHNDVFCTISTPHSHYLGMVV